MWSNTCCGHPLPGEPAFLAAVRRTIEELGCAPALLQAAGTVVYDLPDPLTDLVEKEYNHLFIGTADPDAVDPDPLEALDTRFVTPDQLLSLRQSHPFSAWFPVVFEAALPAVHALFPTSNWTTG